MTRDGFINQVKGKIKEFLPEAYQERDVLIHEFDIDGKKKLAFAMTGGEKNEVPAANLGYYYQLVTQGKELDTVLQELAADYQMLEEREKLSNVVAVKTEDVLNRLHVAVINFKQHPDILAEMPYLKVNDLAVVPMFTAPDGGHIPILFEQIEKMGISGDALLAMAIKNHARMLPPVLTAEPNLQGEMESVDEQGKLPENEIYVLSNEEHAYGAAAIVDKDTLDKISRQLGGDFYILPATMHDVLVVPDKNGIDASFIRKGMELYGKSSGDVKYLSNNIYRYQADSKTVEMYDGKMHQEKVSSRTSRKER